MRLSGFELDVIRHTKFSAVTNESPELWKEHELSPTDPGTIVPVMQDLSFDTIHSWEYNDKYGDGTFSTGEKAGNMSHHRLWQQIV